MQFVGGNIKMLDTMKDKVYDEKGVFEKMGVRPDQIVDYLSMVGDSSDNIIGVKGIGNKTAIKIIKKEDVKKFKKISNEDKERIKLNMNLIRIGHILTNEDKKEIAHKYKDEALKQPNIPMLRSICRRLGFASILSNFGGIMYEYRELGRKSS
jgi:DNA polymerase-1